MQYSGKTHLRPNTEAVSQVPMDVYMMMTPTRSGEMLHSTPAEKGVHCRLEAQHAVLVCSLIRPSSEYLVLPGHTSKRDTVEDRLGQSQANSS
jgi:hypothetical protein